MSISPIVIAVGLLALLLVSAGVFLASCYRRCTPNQIMVISGNTKRNADAASKYIHGGGAFVFPLIQEHAYLSLTPFAIDVALKNALTNQNIRVNVPSTFTIAISSNPVVVSNATERLLEMDRHQLSEAASDVIFGQLRSVIADMSIEEINADRETFLGKIQSSVGTEVKKLGLELINVNIKDVTDESGYIEAIGQKAAAEAINNASIDVAVQEKSGAIGVAEAKREEGIKVAQNQAEETKGKKEAETNERIYVQEKETEAVKGENTSKQVIAVSNSELAIAESNAQREARVQDEKNTVLEQNERAESEKARLTAEVIVPQQIKKEKQIIEAQAGSDTVRITAEGDADSIFLNAEAEARGVEAMLNAKAEGFGRIVEKAGGPEYAVQLLVTEQLPELARIQVEAIRDLKIDKLIVWENGSGSGGLGGMMDGMMSSLPGFHDLAKQAGLELPEFLGKVLEEDDKGGDPAPRSLPASS